MPTVDGLDIDARIAVLLSTFLGHKDPLNTYWYLTASPELMTAVSDRMATALRGGRSDRPGPHLAVVVHRAPHLPARRQPQHVAAYRDCMRLLLCYAHRRHGVQPAQLDLSHLDDHTIAGFLDMLERRTSRQRRHPQRPPGRHPFAVQLRLFRHPEHAELIARVLAIPPKTARRTPSSTSTTTR